MVMGDVRRHGHGAEEVGIAPRGLSGGEEAIMMQHRAGSQRIAKGDVSSRPPRPVGGVLVALPGPWAGTASRAFSPASPRPLGLSGPRFPAPDHPDACGARRRGPCPQGPMDRARPSQPPLAGAPRPPTTHALPRTPQPWLRAGPPELASAATSAASSSPARRTGPAAGTQASRLRLSPGGNRVRGSGGGGSRPPGGARP